MTTSEHFHHGFWIFAISGLLGLSACAGPDQNHSRTLDGKDLGELRFRVISEAESRVHFTDPGDVRSREATSLSDRYMERLTLRNGAKFTLERVYLGTVGSSDSYALQKDLEGEFAKARDLPFDATRVKSAGYLTYIVPTSAKATCFYFRGTVGSMAESNPPMPIDQAFYGGICYRAGVRTAEALESEMLSLLARARFDDADRSGRFALSLKIPDSVGAVENEPATAKTQPTAERRPQSPSGVANVVGSRSVPERLRDLRQLYSDKLITPDEYDTRRKEILNEL